MVDLVVLVTRSKTSNFNLQTANMDLEKIVREFLEREDISGENIGVAVSGGVDSMVLLDLVAKNYDAG